MKKRILFVDDETLVLQGIQRMLRPMRHEWEMDFAEGGVEALELVGRTAYDVIVTDMMMPGMDGSELLHEVRRRSPKTIRLVLSGHAEQHLAMRCVGIAHQYLSKPCDATMLRNTVGRVTTHGFAIRNEQVMTLVAQLRRLPSIPATYAAMVRLLNNPNTSMDDVGALIARDMAMTAKILQIVNSSFFAPARRVSKPADAASYLGLDTLKSLVLATNVFCQFEAALPKGFCAEHATAHSERVSSAARAIARAEKAPREIVDEALVAGLLHDIGKLVLASNLPEQFEQAMEKQNCSIIEAEVDVFGTTHADVGGYLLGLWGLPSSVVQAITLHHSPGESSDEEFSALTAVHVADCLVAERADPLDERAAAVLDTDYLEKLGLLDRLPAWREAVDQLFTSTSEITPSLL